MVIHLYRILLNVAKVFLLLLSFMIGLALFANICMAETNATKITPEEAFLQGQQYISQNNLALAELSLTRIAASSPYAKILAGNIANQKGDIDRTFLLLLPLQTNNSLLKPALISLHASLADAYQKQGDIISSLDQLIRKESYIDSAQAIDNNHQIIWQLLAERTTEELITMRGESADSTMQGWIDLSLAAKNQMIAASIAAWQKSYADHAAAHFAKQLISSAEKSSAANTSAANSSTSSNTLTLTAEGDVALILPFDDPRYAEQANAFKQGLQTAFSKHGIPNVVKSYAYNLPAENLADLRAFAQAEGASYVIGPMADIGLSVDDEVQAITKFMTRNAMQNVLMIGSDSVLSNNMVEHFNAVWQKQLGHQTQQIMLTKDVLNLKNQIQTTPHDLVLLAISANDLRAIRSELDISTPTIGFSSVYDTDIATTDTPNLSNRALLNAIRWADIPFLFDALLPEKNQQYAEYQAAASHLASNDLKRWFALGVDYLALLAMRESRQASIINGLTGQISINESGAMNRTLPIAQLTYEGLVFE